MSKLKEIESGLQVVNNVLHLSSDSIKDAALKFFIESLPSNSLAVSDVKITLEEGRGNPYLMITGTFNEKWDIAGFDANILKGAKVELKISEKKGLFFNLTVTCSSSWNIFISDNGIENVALTFNYQSEDKSSFNGEITGTLVLGGVHFAISVDYSSENKGLDIKAKSIEGEKIDVTAIVKALESKIGVNIPFSLPQIKINSVEMDISTEDSSFTIDCKVKSSGKSLTFINKSYELDYDLKLDYSKEQGASKKTFSAWFDGSLNIGSSEFDVRFGLGKYADEVYGSWNNTSGKGLSFNDVILFLGLPSSISVPEGLNLAMEKVVFQYGIKKKEFTLSAFTKEYGNAFLSAGKDSTGSFGFVFGVNFESCPKFSAIPGVGKYLKAADFIQIKEASIILSDGTFNKYKIPALPNFSDEAKANLPAANNATLDLKTGVSLACEVDMAATANDDVIIKNLNSITGTDVLVLQILYTTSAISIKSILEGSVTIPTGGSGLTISNPAIEIDITPEVFVKLSGDFSFSIDGTAVVVTITMTISETEAAVSGTVKTPDGSFPAPPGLKGLHMTEIGLLMGVFFEPPSLILGVDGKFKIGKVQTKDDEFSFVLQIIEEVPNPLYLSFYVDKLDIGTMVTLFTDEQPGGDVMRMLNKISANKLSFYWAETDVVLPDGTTATQGFAFNAELDIFGFGMYTNCKVSRSSGIEGKAQTNPINLKDILVITGDGQVIERTVDKATGNVISNKQTLDKTPATIKKTIVEAGGPHIEINTSQFSLDANWQISLFDIEKQSVNIKIDSNGVTFDLSYSIAGIESFELKNTLKGWDDYSGEASFQLGVDETIHLSKVGIPLGSIHLEATVGADFKAHVSLKEIMFAIKDMGFSFMGLSLTVPDIKLDVNLRSLSGLAKEIVNQIINNADKIFYALISDPLIFAKHVYQDVIKAAKEVGSVLKEAYNQTANEVAKTMKDAGYAVDEVAKSLKAAFEDTAEVIGDALSYAGYGYSAVVTGLHVIGKTGEEIGHYLNGLGLPVDTVKDILDDVTDVPGDVLKTIGDITHIY